jgi:hypothetical protein
MLTNRTPSFYVPPGYFACRPVTLRAARLLYVPPGYFACRPVTLRAARLNWSNKVRHCSDFLRTTVRIGEK